MQFFSYKNKANVTTVTYNQFIEMVDKHEVKSILVDLKEGNSVYVTGTDGKQYKTANPKTDTFKKEMLVKGVDVKEATAVDVFEVVSKVISTTITALFVFILYKQMKGTFKSSKTNEIVTVPDVKFSDVAGLEEVKEDTKQIVDFMKNPKRYKDCGAKMPKGAVLYGPPGTGKTLIAKAIAGEAGVPFFSVSGSDFVEMFVGLGAKRVRELFENAKKSAPSIIFIDEIDAIGSKRGEVGGNSELRQTINALLAEMDGFSGSEGVFILCATNRLEDLDDALIRPGRFDKHIAIPIPQTPEEREKVFNIYKNVKGRKFAKDVDFKALAKETIGFSPAQIEAFINEAVLIGLQNKKRVTDKQCFDEAIFKILLKGHAKKDAKRDIDELELVAWHEGGHALVGKLLGMDIPKVTITASTSGAGGVTFINPKKMGLFSIEEIKNRVMMSYGGRCGELLLYNNPEKITTGASADIESATSNIYSMVTQYGMTEKYGMLNLNALHIDNKVILDEVVKLAKELEGKTLSLLKENKETLRDIANALLDKETISGEELDEIINNNKSNVSIIEEKLNEAVNSKLIVVNQ